MSAELDPHSFAGYKYWNYRSTPSVEGQTGRFDTSVEFHENGRNVLKMLVIVS